MIGRKPFWLLAPLFALMACHPVGVSDIMSRDLVAGPTSTSGSYQVLATNNLAITDVQVDSFLSGSPKERLADGSLSTAWTNGGYRNPTSWARVGFASSVALASVSIKTGASPTGTSYDVLVSSDGANWTTKLANQKNTTWNLETKTLPVGTTGKYVRIFWRNSTTNPQAHFSIYELQVQGGTSSGTLSPSPSPSPSEAYSAYYPDLTTIPSKNFYVVSSGATRTLRFPGTIANPGPGHLQVRGVVEGDQTRAFQEIVDPSGRVVYSRDVGTWMYHPDHGHVHVSSVARYELRRESPTGTLVKVAPKVSFCLADTIHYIPSSEPERYPHCDTLVQGVTRTYADVYDANLPGQEFDVTGLPAGEYYFVIIIDPLNKFMDAKRTNNMAWTKINLNPSTGRVWTVSTSGG